MVRSLIASLALLAGTLPMTSHAQSATGFTLPADATLLAIQVQGEASRKPDIATLSTGVVTEAPDANTALRENARRMTAVVQAIRAAGIAERDVQTSGVTVGPQYQYQDRQAPRITGYQATNTVSLKVRDLAKLGDVIDALAAQGANQIHGPSFGIDQPEPVQDEARRAAVASARARAEAYAEALGLSVRRIVSINEGVGGGVRPMPMMAMRMEADAGASTPVVPGENTLSVSIEVVFELGR